MIGSLRGKLIFKRAPILVVECAGVGYQVETPMSTFLELPQPSAEIFLHTHLQVREDAQTLYGFSSEEEKLLFRELLKVSGVGAKMGLAILSGMGVSEFERCVQYDDTAMLIRIPGIGRKTAERLVIEMRDRIDHAASGRPVAAKAGVPPNARSEAVDALVSLGYKLPEVKKLLASLDIDGQSAEDIIRQALRQAVH